MEPHRWRPDAAGAVALVSRVIFQLDDESEDESLELLSDLMCAAWGSVLAQNQ